MSLMATANRIKIVCELLEYSRDLDTLSKELRQFPWDYVGDDMAILTRAHIIKVLQLYLDEEIDASKVKQWGRLIECREDIDGEETAREAIIALANPLLEGEMTKEHARRIISSLVEAQ
jgi:hypothetical protein